MIYQLWTLAFGLKLLGATTDVSWHFMHLREALGIPHLINTAGFALAICLALHQTRHRLFSSLLSQRLVWAGIGTFLFAIPLDAIYHELYGLDLTAWGPAHMTLYAGTFLMLLGVVVDYLQAPGPRSPMIGLLLCVMLVDDIVFPLGQQEYGSVGLWLLQQGRPAADAELLSAIGNPFHQAYGGLPLSLYPIYLVGGYLFAMGLVRGLLRGRWAATQVTALYLVYRAIAWVGLFAIGFPAPFVPYFVIAMAVTVDLTAHWLPGHYAAKVVGGVTSAVLAYGTARFWPRLAVMPIWPQESLYLAVIAGVVGSLAVGFLSDWLTQRVQAKAKTAGAPAIARTPVA